MQDVLIVITVVIGGYGFMWYRMGKLTSEVHQHNRILYLILRTLNLNPGIIKRKEGEDGEDN